MTNPRRRNQDTAGQILMEWMRAENLSLRGLAAKLGISHPHLSRVTSGRSPLAADLAQRICGVFGCSEDETDLLICRAGHVPHDVMEKLVEQPELCRLVRKNHRATGDQKASRSRRRPRR